MPESNEAERIIGVYRDRAERLNGSDRYSYFSPSNLFILQGRQQRILSMLRQHEIDRLDGLRILEVGCGEGGVLQEFMTYGANPSNLHGSDLVYERVRRAHSRNCLVSCTCSNGENLPYQESTFDLILQFTVFSSILDRRVRRRVAGEMMRVLHKPDGAILWYDFWINPRNRETRGIRPGEVIKLFPNCRYDFRRITLAPPLARLLVPVSWPLAALLQHLGMFNSHYLALIRPHDSSGSQA
jgi:SAM-dependent methyltransferase